MMTRTPMPNTPVKRTSPPWWLIIGSVVFFIGFIATFSLWAYGLGDRKPANAVPVGEAVFNCLGPYYSASPINEGEMVVLPLLYPDLPEKIVRCLTIQNLLAVNYTGALIEPDEVAAFFRDFLSGRTQLKVDPESRRYFIAELNTAAAADKLFWLQGQSMVVVTIVLDPTQMHMIELDSTAQQAQQDKLATADATLDEARMEASIAAGVQMTMTGFTMERFMTEQPESFMTVQAAALSAIETMSDMTYLEYMATRGVVTATPSPTPAS